MRHKTKISRYKTYFSKVKINIALKTLIREKT